MAISLVQTVGAATPGTLGLGGVDITTTAGNALLVVVAAHPYS